MEVNQRFITSYINNTYSVDSLRSFITFFVLFFVDLTMIPLLLAEPFSQILLKIMMVPIVFLHAFGIWIMINPYKRQILAQLFIGVFGVLTSICYLVLLQKIMYGIFKIHSPWYAVVSIFLYVIALPILYRWHHHNLHSGYYQRSKRRKRSNQVMPFVPNRFMFPLYMGIFAAHVLYGIYEGHFIPGLYAATLFLLMGVFLMFSLGIHKYMLMKKYPQWLKLQEPYKEKSRRRRKKKSAGHPTE